MKEKKVDYSSSAKKDDHRRTLEPKSHIFIRNRDSSQNNLMS
jgi:hypothetical protein